MAKLVVVTKKRPRFMRREDGVWVWNERVEDPSRAGYPKEKPPLEWDRVSLKRCLDRYNALAAKHNEVTASNNALVDLRVEMGKWIDGRKITPEYLATLRQWANWSLHEEAMLLVAEEYWARVCNAVILGGES